ncbi:hypothetical protein OQA88_10704 [Cercophora sp. LCS_1]
MHILQHCGPEAFAQTEMLAVCRACRSLLLCQTLNHRTFCFLQDDAWKSLPWQDTPKSFEDRLMDIFIELPGIAEAAAKIENRERCLERVITLSAALGDWRRDWHAAHSDAVRRVSPMANGIGSCLEFDSPRLALDILYYNAALLYLMQLGAVARGQPALQEMSAVTKESFAPLHKKSVSQKGPLLLPDEVQFRCQPAVEALMTIPYITNALSVTSGREMVVTPAPLGVVYSVLRSERQLLADMDLSMPTSAIFQDAEKVLDGYSAFSAYSVGIKGESSWL